MAIEVATEAATGLSETNDAFAARLQAIFADEARLHLAAVRAALAALADSADGVDPAGLKRSLRDALHTLKGAAHAVGMNELELLCHALDTAIAAPRAQLEAQFGAAVELAGELLASPSGRLRNRALAMAGQLDSLAARAAVQPASCPVA